jgi:hypothetical protein
MKVLSKPLGRKKNSPITSCPELVLALCLRLQLTLDWTTAVSTFHTRQSLLIKDLGEQGMLLSQHIANVSVVVEAVLRYLIVYSMLYKRNCMMNRDGRFRAGKSDYDGFYP